jgi:hypothetical protein
MLASQPRHGQEKPTSNSDYGNNPIVSCHFHPSCLLSLFLWRSSGYCVASVTKQNVDFTLQHKTMIHSRKMRLVGHVASMGIIRNAYTACQSQAINTPAICSGVTIGQQSEWSMNFSKIATAKCSDCLKKCNHISSHVSYYCSIKKHTAIQRYTRYFW